MKRKALLLSVIALSLAGLGACGGGSSSGGGSGSVSVSVSPRLAEVAMGVQSQTFTATVTGSTDTNVQWSVDGTVGGDSTIGTITGGGVYFPPTVAGTHTVTATASADNTKSATATVAVTDLAGVVTYHNDLARDGANAQEYLLSSTTVTQATFGKLFSCPVDGAVYTQPLWVPGVNIPSGPNSGVHNVVYVATQHDNLYAFDADANPCVTLWQVSLIDTLHGGTAGETPIVWNDVGNVANHCYGDIYPEVGVTGTPVIDLTNSAIFVVSASEIPGAGSGTCSLPAFPFFHRLHALDITTGNEKVSPVTITAQVMGNGDGSVGGFVNFNSQLHHQRSGLALSTDGTLYVAFAAHEDQTPYHGWLLGYSSDDILESPFIFNTTPNGGLGGIWAGGGAPAIDITPDVYVATGNGIFDANSITVPFNDYGDSILRIHRSPGGQSNGTGLAVAGWFTPDDQLALSSADADLGSGGVVLLPDQNAPLLPTHLLVQVGKAQPQTGGVGMVYLVDRDNMGQFSAAANNVVQSFAGPTYGVWGTPAFWQNNLYIGGQGDNLKQFVFVPSTGLFTTTPGSQTTQVFNYTGTTPSISSQGSSNGIVWALDVSMYGYANPNAGVNCSTGSAPPAACSGPAILHAYDASNLGTELWNSTLGTGNQAGNAVKFVPPTIANGKVYVSTRTEIDVYGVLPN